MASTAALKILVAGDVDGNFDQLFSRIRSIQKKSGNFDLLLCVGDFFGKDDSTWKPYLAGEKKVPLSTLILGPNQPNHVSYYSGKDGSELCDNITYLGKKGMFTGSSGLQLAYLSGLESSDEKGDDTHFCNKDISSLTLPVISDSKFKGVDILITSQWPRGVDKYGIKMESVDTSSNGSIAVSQLAMHLQPRYHFAGMEGEFYERQPYRNHKVLADKEKHVTRFIGMANTSNKEKKKYLYAFNIVPLSVMDPTELTKQPADVTECPYKLTMSKQALQKETEEKAGQFFYDMTEKKSSKRKGHDGGGPDRKKKHPQPTGPCWFCLGSPEVEKHLVVSVGDHNYLALAKGGLVEDHILILPIGHHQSTVLAPSEVVEEIEKYKSALKKCYKSLGKAVVFFERNYRTQHLQIQVVPVPIDSVCDIKETFTECAQSEGFELFEIPKHSDLKQIVPPGAPYFYTELPSGDKLLHRISKNFPLQFGRDVLASPQILNMTERVDWKACKVSKEREADQASDFKSVFSEFDFNEFD